MRPEQTAAKPSLRPDPITPAGIRNSFDFAARLVGGGRTVHPVSRVFGKRISRVYALPDIFCARTTAFGRHRKLHQHDHRYGNQHEGNYAMPAPHFANTGEVT